MPRTCPTCQIEWADDVDTCPDDGAALPPEDDHLVGRTIGSYRILKRLGKGGMGAVYLGQHPVIGSKVAIKFLHAQFSQDQRVVDRFFNEARAVNLIGHDNILKILDLNVTDDGMHFFVMEFLEGRSLQALVETRQKAVEKWVPAEEAGPILLQCAEALQAAHDKGIIHRDLKPDNVFLVSRNGRRNVVKVVDFGIARLNDAKGVSTGQTQTGMVMGTPVYMSPEQASGATKQIDARSDIYSMGVMAFQLFCGRLPFQGKSFGELLMQHLQKEPPKPRSINPNLPAEIDAVLLTALQKKQDDRFQTMAEFSDALRDALLANGLPDAPPLEADGVERSGNRKPPSGGRALPKKPAPVKRKSSDTLVDDDEMESPTLSPALPTVRDQPKIAAAPAAARVAPRGTPKPQRVSAFDDGAGSTVPVQGMQAAPAPPPQQGDLDGGTVPMLQPVPMPADTGPGGRSRPLGGGSERSASGRSQPGRALASESSNGRGQPPAATTSKAPLYALLAVVVLGLLVGLGWLGLHDEEVKKPVRRPRVVATDPEEPAAPAAPPTVTLSVGSEPPGAQVLASWATGSGAGSTPFALEVPKGINVELVFSLEGYNPKTQRVLADGPRNIGVQLRAAPAAQPPPPVADPAQADAPRPAPKAPKAAPAAGASGDAAKPPPKKGKDGKEDLINPF